MTNVRAGFSIRERIPADHYRTFFSQGLAINHEVGRCVCSVLGTIKRDDWLTGRCSDTCAHFSPCQLLKRDLHELLGIA